MIRYKVGYMKYTSHPCFQHGRPTNGPSSSSSQNNLVQQLCRLLENLHEQNNTKQRRVDTRDNRPETVGKP